MLTPSIAKADIRGDGRTKFDVAGPKDKLVAFDGRITVKNLTGTFEQGGWRTLAGDAMYHLPRENIGQVAPPLCK
jgi:hypothetical protein